MNRDKPHDDAFGQGLWDYHETGSDSPHIIERDDGAVAVAGSFASYFGDPYEQGDGALLRKAKGRVLDLGCGAGRHALALQAAGHEVMGIDRSRLAIKVCRARGLQQARAISITRISRRLGTFDTVIAMGNNFGLFANPRRARWLLSRLRGMTADHARLIVESNDVHQTDDPMHLAYHRRNRRRGRLAGELRLRTRYRRHVEPWFDYFMVSRDEMADIIEGAGWRITRVIERPHRPSQYAAVIEKA